MSAEPVVAAEIPGSAVDPYADRVAAPPLRFLYGLNPLVKLLAPVPAMVLLVFVRDIATPSAFLALSYAVLLVGVNFTRRLAAILLLAVPLGILLLGVGFSLWTDAAQVDSTPVVAQLGAWTLYRGALEIGFASALRIVAIIALALPAGLSTTGPDLVRS
ncbi:MAG: energy-coupling factor transporter transmembrane component T, partial [Microbacterium pygmaeum]